MILCRFIINVAVESSSVMMDRSKNLYLCNRKNPDHFPPKKNPKFTQLIIIKVFWKRINMFLVKKNPYRKGKNAKLMYRSHLYPALIRSSNDPERGRYLTDYDDFSVDQELFIDTEII